MRTAQKFVLIISILASFVAFLDGFIVNIALPAIAREFGGGLMLQQWVVNAYMITLGALMLLAGSLSDLFGRKKILGIGLAGFGITSLLCALAPNGLLLVIARGLQGITGALLVPSSLALIMSTFSGPAKSKAIGTWTAWTILAPAIGPLVGGALVDSGSWRWIFAINVLPIAMCLWLLRRLSDKDARANTIRIDSVGSILCSIGLGGIVFAFVEQPHFGWGSPAIYAPLIVGIAAFTLFLRYEQRAATPMLPLELFKVGNFRVGNIATFAIYGALAISTFLMTIFVQQVGHYSATFAGLAFLPTTILMFLLSSKFGALAGKYGPRAFMTAGPIVIGAGMATLLRTDATAHYWTQILPSVLLFGVGLSIMVAPLTAAILGSIPAAQSGIASAVNNAVSRIAGLIGVAALGLVVGPTLTVATFHKGILFCVVLFVLGGIVSAIGISNKAGETPKQELPA